MDNNLSLTKKLKTIFSIYPEVLFLFILGCFSGFITAILLPATGRSYFQLYASDVTLFLLRFQSKLGTTGAAVAISMKNIIPISILTFLPYILVAYHARLGLKIVGGGVFDSLESSLRLLSFCPIFAYGFAVYGLFIGHISMSLPLSIILKYLSASMIHGWLEILAMLSAGSTGLYFAEVIGLKRGDFETAVNFMSTLKRWCWLAAVVVVAAIIESFVSPISISISISI